MIVIGQKDGHAWGLDPDKQGEVMWSRQLGLGWENGGGGMMWGSAADERLAYFPVTGNDKPLGLAAVHLGTGEIAWRGVAAGGGGGAGHGRARRRLPGIQQRDGLRLCDRRR